MMQTEVKKISRAQAVGKIAGLLVSDAFTNGDRARLRRLNPDAPLVPEVWKVLLYLQEEGAPVEIGNEADERRWALLLMCMAHCISPAQNLHDYRTPLGRALAIAGWTPQRFEQLMRARGPQLVPLLRRMAQYLAARGIPANWADVADLLFEQKGQKADNVRLRIARDYYTQQYHQENQ